MRRILKGANVTSSPTPFPHGKDKSIRQNAQLSRSTRTKSAIGVRCSDLLGEIALETLIHRPNLDEFFSTLQELDPLRSNLPKSGQFHVQKLQYYTDYKTSYPNLNNEPANLSKVVQKTIQKLQVFRNCDKICPNHSLLQGHKSLLCSLCATERKQSLSLHIKLTTFAQSSVKVERIFSICKGI